MQANRTVKKPRRPAIRNGWKPNRSLIPALRWFLILTWALLILTSHDELQTKAIQLVACLMEMLALSACRDWPC